MEPQRQLGGDGRLPDAALADQQHGTAIATQRGLPGGIECGQGRVAPDDRAVSRPPRPVEVRRSVGIARRRPKLVDALAGEPGAGRASPVVQLDAGWQGRPDHVGRRRGHQDLAGEGQIEQVSRPLKGGTLDRGALSGRHPGAHRHTDLEIVVGRGGRQRPQRPHGHERGIAGQVKGGADRPTVLATGRRERSGSRAERVAQQIADQLVGLLVQLGEDDGPDVASARAIAAVACAHEGSNLYTRPLVPASQPPNGCRQTSRRTAYVR